MRLYHYHTAVLSLLQCESTTNVTIVVQLQKEKKFKNKKIHFKLSWIPRPTRKFRGKTEALHATAIPKYDCSHYGPEGNGHNLLKRKDVPFRSF